MHPAIWARTPPVGTRLLPTDVAWVQTTVARAYVDLFPAEQQVASAFSPLRWSEFATGRACARDALIALGLPAVALPPGPAGDPVWPDGVVGSITHCLGYWAVAVALASSYGAIGIDAEPHLPVPPDVLRAVADPGELVALEALPADGTAWDRVLFSAKESTYKAWFPSTRGEVLATEIVVRLDPEGGFVADIGGVAMRGRWAIANSLVQTAAWVCGTVPSPRE